MRNAFRVVLGLGVALASVSAIAAESLTIGSKAPVIDVAHWFNGKEPVEAFDDGTVYVIEFWATWCGPCVASMPHLRDLQQRHGDAITVVSVSDESPEVIEKFLERETGETTFREITGHYWLATDPDGSVKQDYMRAAGQHGIPTAFIVGKSGLVEWIGHPMQMDAPVAGVLSGEWDRDAYAKQMREEKEVEIRLQAVQRLIQQKRFSEAVKAVDRILADNLPPQMQDRLAAARRKLEQQALDHAKKEASQLHVQTVTGLVDMAFLMRDGDADAALAALDRLMKQSSDPRVRAVLARAREKMSPERNAAVDRIEDELQVKPVARFRFDGNAENTGTGSDRFELSNTEFVADALYLNGSYENGGDGTGYRASCRVAGFDYQPFAVAVRFKAEEFGGSKTNLVTGGTSYRWFGLSRSHAGNLVVTFNNQRERHVIPGTMLEADCWIVVACSVDPSRGQLLVSVDRKEPIAVKLGEDFGFVVAESDSRDRDKTLDFTNYSNGQVFHGLIDELLFYDQPLSAEELVRVPLQPERP